MQVGESTPMRISTERSMLGEVCVRASSTSGSTTCWASSQKRASSCSSVMLARCPRICRYVSSRAISRLLELIDERLDGGRRGVGVGRQEGDVVGRRHVALGRLLERVAHVALAHAGDVEVLGLYLLGALRDDDDLARGVLRGIASAHLHAHLLGEVELRPVVLAGAGVLG